MISEELIDALRSAAESCGVKIAAAMLGMEASALEKLIGAEEGARELKSESYPFPAHAPVVRARRIARLYRRALQKADPAMAARIDQQCTGWGEDWVSPPQVHPESWLTTSGAAQFAGTTDGILKRLREKGILPGKFGPDGQWRYLARDVEHAVNHGGR